jgi:aminoglycoside phosphotransferase
VTAVGAWGASGAGSLKDALTLHLPGLARAMDPQWARSQLEQMLIDSSRRVASVEVASLRYRGDRSCTFRYRVDLPDGRTGEHRQMVLGRVCQGSGAVGQYLATVLALGASLGTGAPDPWRVWAARTADPGVALHVFPIDPELPTLGKALEPASVAHMLRPRGDTQPLSVAVVRYSRRGSCVLRYAERGQDQAGIGPVRPVAFGKVYADDTGATAYEFLRSVESPLRHHRRSTRSTTPGPESVDLPTPLAYDARCRFLLTDVVRGESTVSSLLAAKLSDESALWPEAGRASEVTELLTSCGRVLATLHRQARARAPIRQSSESVRELHCELNTVSRIWPKVAQEVRGHVQEAARELSSPGTAVLCHGDYTPSQALSSRGLVTGLVDFDAVCWADPASDLGRFLAHLDLLVTKYLHARAPHTTAALAASFLNGYLEGTVVTPQGERALLRRVAAYRTLSLATTALHACLQLKDHRLGVALSMLRTTDQWTGRASP